LLAAIEFDYMKKKGVVASGGIVETMKRSINRILTTHVGSLPRSPDMIDLMRAVGRGEPFDAHRREEMVKTAVFDAVARQIEAGVDIVSDGEMGKPGFINYTNDRLGGFERAPANTCGRAPVRPTHFRNSTNPRSRISTDGCACSAWRRSPTRATR
jgi:hypothetical protein